MEKALAKTLQYLLKFHILIRGWLASEFHLEEDVENILAKRWHWGPSIMDTKRWELGFDSWKEVLQVQSMWVKMSSLSMEV
jgi:hypothetical protein